MRRNNKIFQLLKDWRLESGVVDKIEELITGQIDWFDSQSLLLQKAAESAGVRLEELRDASARSDRADQEAFPAGQDHRPPAARSSCEHYEKVIQGAADETKRSVRWPNQPSSPGPEKGRCVHRGGAR